MIKRGPNDLEEIIQRQKSCIERQQVQILELEKRVDILTEEIQANQLEISKLLNNK
jgi:hypothetical protein